MTSGIRALAAATVLVAVSVAAPARADEPVAVIEIVNAGAQALAFRAGSGFQGRFETPLADRLAPGESARAQLRAGFPDSQGGGFRYGAPGGAECDFGFLRLRGPGGVWLPPSVRAGGSGGANCRARVTATEAGGSFSVRFTLE